MSQVRRRKSGEAKEPTGTSPTLRNRKPLDSDTEPESDIDGGIKEIPKAPASGHSKGDNKRSKIYKRLVFGTLLLFVLCGIIAAGHLCTILFVLFIQWAMFRELVNVRYQQRLLNIPLFRTSQWGWFWAGILLSYGQALQKPGRAQLIESQLVLICLPYMEAVALLLYSVLLVGTVLTLRTRLYKYQMGQLAWTVSMVVITVAQAISFSANIINGLFWFLFPVSLVICNDSMAYFCGMGFGRKLIKRPFLGDLSPNKTWEGFIFGGLCTVIFAFITPPLYPTQILCPCQTLSLIDGGAFSRTCTLPAVFTWHAYALPEWVQSSFGLTTINLLPIQFHALVLGLFASIVAPFGGFFASGIKRAYKLDDFASIIPGHGGVFDRVDCQLIMGLATQTYYITFIRASEWTVPHLLSCALTLPDSEKVQLYKQIGSALKKQGLLHR